MSCDAGSSATSHSSPWQKSALFAVSIVGAVCDRAFFLELTKCGRSQTAPTVGNPSLRLLPRAVRRGVSFGCFAAFLDSSCNAQGLNSYEIFKRHAAL